MATLVEYLQGQDRLTHTIMLDFTAILIGYGFGRDEARQIATKAVEVTKEHLDTNPMVLRRRRF